MGYLFFFFFFFFFFFCFMGFFFLLNIRFFFSRPLYPEGVNVYEEWRELRIMCSLSSSYSFPQNM